MKTLALVGVGRWGKNIIATLETIPVVKLKYLCARNWPELLEKKDLEAVIIATPPSTHASIAIPFLERGIPVFVEKPMVLSVTEAEKLRAVVKKSRQVFMVGYQYLYNDYINYLKKELGGGAFGKILVVKSEHLVSPPRPDVDIFWDAGPHPLSIFQYFFTPQKLISAEGEIKHDSVSVKVKFEKAPELKIIASCFGKVKTRKLSIVGEKATAVLDEILEKNKLAITKNGQTINPQIDFRPPLRNELEYFIQCLETGAIPLTSIDFGYIITEWLEEISRIDNFRDKEKGKR